MSTEVDVTTTVKGKKCAESLMFNGLEIDKGIFTVKIRTKVRVADGSYVVDPDPLYNLDNDQTALMMADSFEVVDSEGAPMTLSGVEVFQWIAQAMDKTYAGFYPKPEPVEPEPEV
jgi:hypothetical protein